MSVCTTDISELRHFDPIRFVSKKWKLFIIRLFLCQPHTIRYCCIRIGSFDGFSLFLYMFVCCWFDAANTCNAIQIISISACRIFHIIIIIVVVVSDIKNFVNVIDVNSGTRKHRLTRKTSSCNHYLPSFHLDAFPTPKNVIAMIDSLWLPHTYTSTQAQCMLIQIYSEKKNRNAKPNRIR